jgi:hypothetical protein
VSKKDFDYWISYPQKIARVRIIRRGTGGRKLRQPVENPMVVEDDDENQFVVANEKIFDNPIAATQESIKLANCLGVPPMVEVPDGDTEEDPDDDDEDENLDSDPDSGLEEEEEDDPDSESDPDGEEE